VMTFQVSKSYGAILWLIVINRVQIRFAFWKTSVYIHDVLAFKTTAIWFSIFILKFLDCVLRQSPSPPCRRTPLFSDWRLFMFRWFVVHRWRRPSDRRAGQPSRNKKNTPSFRAIFSCLE
jgi:hypothetical protein